MPRVNKTRYAPLGILNTGAYSGHDIKLEIERSIGQFWHESYGQIYPILGRLEEVCPTTAQTETLPGHPARSVYTITDQGHGDFFAGSPHPSRAYPSSEMHSSSQPFWGNNAHREVTVQHLRDHRQHAENVLAMFGEIATMLVIQAHTASGLPFWQPTLRYGQIQAEAFLSWCDETLQCMSGTG